DGNQVQGPPREEYEGKPLATRLAKPGLGGMREEGSEICSERWHPLFRARRRPVRAGRLLPRRSQCSQMKWQAAPARSDPTPVPDRKSTRLNSSHVKISYA